MYSQERKFNREQKAAQDKKDLAKKELDLCVARILLLENYEKCMNKGYYTVNERSVYHQLYENYVELGGDGVIEDIMEKLIELPTEKEE